MKFEIIGRIERQETIAVGEEIREIARLRKFYGQGKWKKKKGVGTIKLSDGTAYRAEVHWYELHGVGRKEIKIKKLLP